MRDIRFRAKSLDVRRVHKKKLMNISPNYMKR